MGELAYVKNLSMTVTTVQKSKVDNEYTIKTSTVYVFNLNFHSF